VEKDESARRFVVEAKGKDKRGNGTATAKVTASMTTVAEGATEVEVLTDLSITGRPAQFGRGVIQDVSDKLLQQFVTCLEQKVGGSTGAASASAGAASAAEAEAAAAAAAAGEVGVTASAEPTVPEQPTADRREPSLDTPVGGVTTNGVGPGVDGVAAATSSPVEALDLGSAILPVLLKRYWQPAAGALGALIGLLVLIRLLRRRH
jgi:uncharacterized protein